MTDEYPHPDTERGQLVLIAAVALAVVLIPLILAFLQLGYHADVAAGGPTITESDVEQPLQQALHDATASTPERYTWDERHTAAESVTATMAPSLDTLNQSAVEDGTLIRISPNESHAQARAATNCPGGADRDFGDCVTSDGLILQERDDRTHVLGAAYDIAISTPEKDIELTTVIERR